MSAISRHVREDVQPLWIASRLSSDWRFAAKTGPLSIFSIADIADDMDGAGVSTP